MIPRTNRNVSVVPLQTGLALKRVVYRQFIQENVLNGKKNVYAHTNTYSWSSKPAHIPSPVFSLTVHSC